MNETPLVPDVCGYNIPFSKVKAIAEKLKLNPLPFEKIEEAKQETIVLFDEINDEDLNKLFSSGMTYFVDVHNRKLVNMLSEIPAKGITKMVFSTKNAHNLDLGSFLADKVAKIMKTPNYQKNSIRLAIHEAISNAIIHGNLEISNRLRGSVDLLEEFGKLLKQRLSERTHASRALEVSMYPFEDGLKITIVDDGSGFNSEEQTSVPDYGLKAMAKIADNITIDKNGREVTLTFISLGDFNKRLQNKNYGKNNSNDLSFAKVLIIEDDKKTQALIGKLLNILGINKLFYSENGEDSLSKAMSIIPDLIILNLNLPGMKGDIVLAKLKENPILKDIPVLVETAYSDNEIRDSIFKLGANDYLTKPFSIMEFFSRVKINLENRLLISALENELKRIITDLRSAKSIQSWSLPKQQDIRAIKEKYKVNINNLFLPSPKLSGDFWGMQELATNKIAIFCCNFSGHGITAILNTFKLSSLIRENPILYPFSPANYLKDINNVLSTIIPKDQFVTFLYGVFDTSNDVFTYATAGAPSPVLIEHGNVTFLTAKSQPLGVDKTTKYTEYKLDFKKGTTIVLYSDTMASTPYIDNKELGIDGLKKIIMKYHATKIVNDANETFDSITCELLSNIPDASNIKSDLTLLHITREQ